MGDDCCWSQDRRTKVRLDQYLVRVAIFTSARISAATLHQRMDFAAAWVRRERSSSAGCRKQILRPLPFPESVGRAEQLEEGALVARVESSLAEVHSVLRPDR